MTDPKDWERLQAAAAHWGHEFTDSLSRDVLTPAALAGVANYVWLSDGSPEHEAAALAEIRKIVGEPEEANPIYGAALKAFPDDAWRCECGDLNMAHEAFCYRCGAGQPDEEDRAASGHGK